MLISQFKLREISSKSFLLKLLIFFSLPLKAHEEGVLLPVGPSFCRLSPCHNDESPTGADISSSSSIFSPDESLTSFNEGLLPPFVKILSIDGGGARGIIPAIGIKNISTALGKMPNSVFDYIIGTSVGAIIGSALACGIEPEKIVSLFIQNSKDIFFSSNWKKIKTLNGLIGAPYSTRTLISLLQETFGTTRLSDIKNTELILTGYDTQAEELICFSTVEARKDPAQDFLLVDCILASTAAPTKFPPKIIQGHPYIDGGVCVNDPAFLGISLVSKYRPEISNKEKACISLGTGKTKSPLKPTKNWGLLCWAPEITDTLMKGNSSATSKVSENSLPLGQYIRFQPDIDKRYSRLDDISIEAQQNRIEIAENLYSKKTQTFKDALNLLTQIC